VLTHAAGWHWVFFVNLPIGVAAIAATRAVVPQRPGLGLGRDVDVAGAVLVTAATAIGVLAVLRAPDDGWTAARTLGLAGTSLALFAAFAGLESRVAHPILPGHVLRLPSLLGSSAVRAVMGVGSYGCFFLGALYLQRVLGYGTLRAGVAFLPQTMAVAAVTLGPTAWLVRRYGPVRTTLGGLAATVAGLLVLGSAGSGYVPAVLVAFLLLGVGGGTAILPLMTIAMRDVPARDTGVASAVVSMSLYLPGAFGLAVLGALAADRSRTLAERGWAPVEALAAGYHLAFVVAATCVAVCLVATTALLRREVTARSA
jgi:MFS family permease